MLGFDLGAVSKDNNETRKEHEFTTDFHQVQGRPRAHGTRSMHL